MNVREYQPDDLLPIIALWRECDLLRPWNDPEQDIARAIACPSATVLLGFDHDALVAACMAGYDGHRGWLYYVGVSPDHRGRGFGKAITAAAEEWLKSQGAVKAMLMVRTTNHAVLGFYESAGYAQSATVALEKWLTPEGKRPEF